MQNIINQKLKTHGTKKTKEIIDILKKCQIKVSEELSSLFIVYQKIFL